MGSISGLSTYAENFGNLVIPSCSYRNEEEAHKKLNSVMK